MKSSYYFQNFDIKQQKKDGSATAILFKMEQLFIEFGNSIFKSIQYRDSDRRHFVLRG